MSKALPSLYAPPFATPLNPSLGCPKVKPQLPGYLSHCPTIAMQNRQCCGLGHPSNIPCSQDLDAAWKSWQCGFMNLTCASFKCHVWPVQAMVVCGTHWRQCFGAQRGGGRNVWHVFRGMPPFLVSAFTWWWSAFPSIPIDTLTHLDVSWWSHNQEWARCMADTGFPGANPTPDQTPPGWG
jgi:hypothetical protein